jgi:hypothetical protein
MSEQHMKAGKANEAEEVLDVISPTGDKAAEVLHLDEDSNTHGLLVISSST